MTAGCKVTSSISTLFRKIRFRTDKRQGLRLTSSTILPVFTETGRPSSPTRGNFLLRKVNASLQRHKPSVPPPPRHPTSLFVLVSGLHPLHPEPGSCRSPEDHWLRVPVPLHHFGTSVSSVTPSNTSRDGSHDVHRLRKVVLLLQWSRHKIFIFRRSWHSTFSFV